MSFQSTLMISVREVRQALETLRDLREVYAGDAASQGAVLTGTFPRRSGGILKENHLYGRFNKDDLATIDIVMIVLRHCYSFVSTRLRGGAQAETPEERRQQLAKEEHDVPLLKYIFTQCEEIEEMSDDVKLAKIKAGIAAQLVNADRARVIEILNAAPMWDTIWARKEFRVFDNEARHTDSGPQPHCIDQCKQHLHWLGRDSLGQFLESRFECITDQNGQTTHPVFAVPPVFVVFYESEVQRTFSELESVQFEVPYWENKSSSNPSLVLDKATPFTYGLVGVLRCANEGEARPREQDGIRLYTAWGHPILLPNHLFLRFQTGKRGDRFFLFYAQCPPRDDDSLPKETAQLPVSFHDMIDASARAIRVTEDEMEDLPDFNWF